MPEAPRINRRQVQERAAPGPPSRVGAPTGAFGGDTGVAGEAKDILEDVQRISAREQLRARRTRLSEFETQLTEEGIRLTGEYRKRKGKNAINAATETLDQYANFYEGLSGTVDDAVLADALESVYNRKRLRMMADAQAYEADQNEVYKKDVYNARLTASHRAIQQGYDSDVTVGMELMSLAQGVEERGQDQGWSGQEIENEVKRQVSLGHLTVISQYLDPPSRNYVGAKKYLDEHGDQLTPEHRDKVDEMMANGGLLHRAHGERDRIMSNPDITWTEARKLVLDIDDDVLQEKTWALVKEALGFRENAKRVDEAAAIEAALPMLGDLMVQKQRRAVIQSEAPALTSLIEPSLVDLPTTLRDALPADVYDRLGSKARTQLEREYFGGGPTQNDISWNLVQKLYREGNLAKLSDAERLRLRLSLDKDHRKKFDTIWKGATTKDLEAQRKAMVVLTAEQRMENAFLPYTDQEPGTPQSDWSDDEKKQFRLFKNRVQMRLDTHEFKTTDIQAIDQQVRGIVADAAMEMIPESGQAAPGWMAPAGLAAGGPLGLIGGTGLAWLLRHDKPDVPLASLSPERMAEYDDLSVDEMPEELVKVTKNWLATAGLGESDELVEGLARAYIAGNTAEFERILAGGR